VGGLEAFGAVGRGEGEGEMGVGYRKRSRKSFEIRGGGGEVQECLRKKKSASSKR